MGKRHAAREMAVQMLYQRDLGGSPLSVIFSTFDLASFRDLAGKDDDEAEPGAAPEPPTPPSRSQLQEAFDYARRLVEGVDENREEIDALIRTQAENWRLERMPAVDRNILRLAVHELMHEMEVPQVVVLDEAVELAKRFGSEQSGRFVNGLLDGLLRTQAFPASRT